MREVTGGREWRGLRNESVKKKENSGKWQWRKQTAKKNINGGILE